MKGGYLLCNWFWQTIIRIVNLRRYNGSFAYIPSTGLEGTGDKNCEPDMCSMLQGAETDNDPSLLKSGHSEPQAFAASEWQPMDGAFLSLMLSNVPFAGENVMSAPLAKVKYSFGNSQFLNWCAIILKLERHFQNRFLHISSITIAIVYYCKSTHSHMHLEKA